MSIRNSPMPQKRVVVEREIIPGHFSSEYQYYNPTLNIAQRLAGGIPPTNRELEDSLAITEEAIRKQRNTRPSMGPYAERIAVDAEHLIHDVRTFIAEKNKHGHVQKMIVELARAAEEEGPRTSQVGKQVTRGATQIGRKLKNRWKSGDIKSTAVSGWSALLLVIRNAEFRTLILDLIALFSEKIKDQAEKKRIEVAATGAVPSAVPTTTAPVVTAPATSIPTGGVPVREYISSGPVRAREYVPMERAPGAPPSSIPQGRYEEVRYESYQAQPSVAYPSGTTYTGMAQPAPAAAVGPAPSPARRFRDIMTNLTKNEEFKNAARSFMSLFDEFYGPILSQSQTVMKQTQAGAQNIHLLKAKDEMTHLIGEFVGLQALESFTSDLAVLLKRVRSDAEVNLVFNQLREYTSKMIENPTLLQDENYIRQSEDIFKRGRDVFQNFQYKNEYNKVFQDIKGMVNTVRNDTVMKNLSVDLMNITRDMILDEQNRPSYDVLRQSLAEIRSLIVPVLLEHIKEIPLPRIEGAQPGISFMVDNLVLYGYDLLPEYVDVHLDSKTEFEPLNLSPKGQSPSMIKIRLRDMKMHLRNVAYSVRKTTIPRFADDGIMDIDLWGDNTELVITYRFRMINGYLQLEDSSCNLFLDKLKLRVKESRRRGLMNLVLRLFGGTIKKRIEKAVSESITNTLNTTNQTINGFLRPRPSRRILIDETVEEYDYDYVPTRRLRGRSLSPRREMYREAPSTNVVERERIVTTPVVTRGRRSRTERHPRFVSRSLSEPRAERVHYVQEVPTNKIETVRYAETGGTVTHVEKSSAYSRGYPNDTVETVRFVSGPAYEPHSNLHPSSIKNRYATRTPAY